MGSWQVSLVKQYVYSLHIAAYDRDCCEEQYLMNLKEEMIRRIYSTVNSKSFMYSQTQWLRPHFSVFHGLCLLCVPLTLRLLSLTPYVPCFASTYYKGKLLPQYFRQDSGGCPSSDLFLYKLSF